LELRVQLASQIPNKLIFRLNLDLQLTP